MVFSINYFCKKKAIDDEINYFFAKRTIRSQFGERFASPSELPTFPSSAAVGAAPSRSPVLASGCHGRTSRGVTVTITMRPTPGAWPRVSTLAAPHAWLRSSLPSSAGPPPGSVAIS